MSEVLQQLPGTASVAKQLEPAPLPDFVLKPKRRRRDIGAGVGVVWIAVVCLGAVLANILPLPDPNDVSNVFNATPGTDGHLLGTDSLGRDVLSRLIFGARVSLAVAIGATSISLVIGVTLGMLGGFFGGFTDKVVSMFVNFTLSFPPLIFLIAMVTVLEASLSTLVIALAIMGIPNFARVARANTLAFADREFVTAAKSLGASPFRILVRELLANVMLPILSLALVVMATLVIAEGSLSFLGVGVPPPTPSWGGMLAAGREQMSQYPHLVLIPALFFFVTVFSFNRIGDWARRHVGKDSAI